MLEGEKSPVRDEHERMVRLLARQLEHRGFLADSQVMLTSPFEKADLTQALVARTVLLSGGARRRG